MVSEEFIGTVEASQIIGVTSATIRNLIKAGKLDGKQVGSTYWVVNKESVFAYKVGKDEQKALKQPKMISQDSIKLDEPAQEISTPTKTKFVVSNDDISALFDRVSDLETEVELLRALSQKHDKMFARMRSEMEILAKVKGDKNAEQTKGDTAPTGDVR